VPDWQNARAFTRGSFAAFGMKAPIFLGFHLLLLAGCVGSGVSSVTYLGEEIRLSRTYPDLEQYEDDENNLPADEIPKVVELVRRAPVSAAYPSYDAAFEALSQLTFPGYGFSAMNLGQPVALFAIEVPQMNEQRYITLEQKDNEWMLVDDFLWADAKGFINSARLIGRRIQYMNHKSRVVRESGL
jgi:hypothetical protein